MARVAKQQQQGPKRAAIYCRVSTAAQAEDEKVSLSEQLADCERYCQEKGYEVVARYQDAKSGSTSKRPDFQRLITAAGEDAFDVVICWKVDRLGRGLFPMARLLEVLEPASITIEAVKEQVDQRYLGLFASVGAIELANIRERTMTTRRAYARQGKMPAGQMAFGYCRDAEGKPAIDENEQTLLLEAAQRYAAGEKPASICKDFRARNIPVRRPNNVKHVPWAASVLTRMLTDAAYYTGQRVYGGETVPFPPLYPAALWDAICRRRDQNTQFASRNTREEYLLQHLLYCKECGQGFKSSTRRGYIVYRNETKERRLYNTPIRRYQCGGMHHYGYTCRQPVLLRAEHIEGPVWEALTAALRRPDSLLTGLQTRLDALEEEQPEEAGGDAERTLAVLKMERLEHLRQRARGKIDDATLDVLLGEIDAQEVYWQERAAADARLSEDREAARMALQQASAYIDGLRHGLERRLSVMTFEERRALVRTLVDRVWIDRNDAVVVEGILAASDESLSNSDTSLEKSAGVTLYL